MIKMIKDAKQDFISCGKIYTTHDEGARGGAVG